MTFLLIARWLPATRAVFAWMVSMSLSAITLSAADPDRTKDRLPKSAGCVRIATLNTSLYRGQPSALTQELESGNSEHAENVAALLQVVRPDVILLNEIDYRGDQRVVRSLVEDYLAVGQQGPEGEVLEPLHLPYWYSGPVNTGVDSGLDLNRDGERGAPEDAWGYGKYPGQYGMALLSRYPLESDRVRTFQKFLWSNMPEPQRPAMSDGTLYYADEVWQKLRLSSKSHWDVPVEIDGRVIHLLVSHPTPPAFDGPEDRNGCRNHDEIKFWQLYVDPRLDFPKLIDDRGQRGGLAPDSRFVILGDLNADPRDGSGRSAAIQALLSHPLVQDTKPASEGAVESGSQLGGANARHQGEAGLDTSQFSPRGVGNLRVDYCLPSRNMQIRQSGVFWPAKSSPWSPLIEFTDHRLVWIDVDLKTDELTP